jgi:hypothetical protein
MVVCALLGAVVLSACGGDDDATSSTSATAPSTGSAPDPAAPGGDTGPTGSGSADDQDAGGENGSDEGGEDSGAGETGLEDGERSKAFVTPGGDNSIQEYGSEGGADERTEALVVIKAVNKASETGKWDEVCARYISSKNIEQFEVIAEKIPKFKGKGCTEILTGLSPGQSGAANPTQPKGGVASIRKDDENAFAIYVGVDGSPYAWPMAVEDGALKATALAPTPLNPGA